jgi:nucleoid DNA-binding protein/cell division septation protein DedD
MVDHDGIEGLAGLLDVERQEAERLLIRFSSAMAAELLAVRKLSLKGLGSFTVKHFPAAKKSSASTVVYTPPGNRLLFTCRLTGADDTIRLAVSRLSMITEDAERFGGALAALFMRAVQQQREIRLNGIGRFALEQGAWIFFPERSLEELLNREYHNLQEVVLPPREHMQDKGAHRYKVPLALFTVFALLLAFFYGMEPKPLFSDTAVPKPAGIVKAAVHAESAAAVVHNESVTVSQTVTPPRAEANGSLVLAPNSYTIVLVTLSKAESVQKELARLRSERVMAFAWPAEVKGITYYRLITGSFSSRQAAREHIVRMAEKTADGAYIQHVIKRVVLHGEKGL